MLFRLAIASTCALLFACAGSPVEPTAPAAAEPAPEVAATPPERPFPDDSLLPLLTAEFALRRREYDVALAEYMVLAPQLRDPGISATAARMAQFLRREDEALEAATLWVELEPQDVEANTLLATLLVRRGRTVEALPHLAYVHRQGNSAHFPVLLNEFDQLQPDERRELITGINALGEEFPDDPSMQLTLALMHTQLEQYDLALADLQKLFALEPDNTQALVLEARILMTQQDPAPFTRIEQALAANPEDKMLRLQYARALTQVDMQAATQQFEILSAQSPGDNELLFSLALMHRETGDYNAASDYLRQVVASGERVNEAHYYLGRIAEDRGEPEEAIGHYLEVGDSREYLAACSRIGEILVAQDKLAQSRDQFARQRTRMPQYAEQLFALEADILAAADYPQQARDTLNEGLRAFPDSASLRYTRAIQSEQAGDLAGMEKDLRGILADDPDNATALNALGYTLVNRTDRHREGLALIARALELEPGEPAILDSMGWALYRTGQLEAALDYLSRAYAGFPDPEVAAHLGEVLWVSGDTVTALEVWRGALARDPDHPVILETLQRLGAALPEAAGPGAPPTP